MEVYRKHGKRRALGALLFAAAALAATAADGAGLRIQDDPGGAIDSYLLKFANVRDSGERVILDGACNSACTLVVGAVPKERVSPFGAPPWDAALTYPQPYAGGFSLRGGGRMRQIPVQQKSKPDRPIACDPHSGRPS